MIPLIDLSTLQIPPRPRALNLMESLGLERGEGKGYIRKLSFPLLELSAINGNVYISMIQTFREDVYYQVFFKELEENGITVNEYGMTPIQTAEVGF